MRTRIVDLIRLGKRLVGRQMAEATVRGFSIATKCETVAAFVEKYRDRCDDTSILVNVVESRIVGTECAFAILLANKKPVLAGTCVVLDVFTDSNNKFKRPGMRLGIKRLGLESERVFAELEAARIAAKRKPAALSHAAAGGAPRPTMAMPIVTAEIPAIHVTPKGDGVVVGVPRTRTQPMRGLSGEAVVIEPRKKRLESVQIPDREEPPARTARSSSSPVEIRAESSSDVSKPQLRIVRDEPVADAEPAAKPEPPAKPEPEQPKAQPKRAETRTPGSSFVLPANPLMNMTDASLEGLVDCRLFESNASAELFDIKDTKVAGTLDLDEPTPLPAPVPARPSTIMETVTPVRHATGFEPTTVEHSTPPPLEPPPPTFARASTPIVGETPRPALARGSMRDATAPEPTPLPPPPVVGEPFAPLPLPYAATRLPDLNVGKTNKNVQPLVSRRVRNRLLLAIALVPALGAGIVVLAMSLQPPHGTAANLAPPVAATIEVAAHASMPDDPPPHATVIVEPTKPQPIHPVLIRSVPVAAKVTAGGTYFGTTPTYIKIPANTPVEVTVERPGFKPVKRTVTSKRRYEQVFVPLRKVGVKRGAR